MQKPEVLFAFPAPPHVYRKISQFCSIQEYTGPYPIPREELLKRLSTVVGLYFAGHRIDQELLSHAPLLKVASTVSVGYDKAFDIEAMRQHGVLGTHTPYVLDDTVADLVMGLMLSTARRIAELNRYVKRGLWGPNQAAKFLGTDVHHQTLGIIGMGRIGRVVAKRAKLGFDMEVLYHNRSRNITVEQDLGVSYASLEEVLSRSDFVVLMVPLTPSTHHYIKAEHLSMMKKEAIFINASRGLAVDEKALIQALQNGNIAGAGLDVFEQEPLPPDHPFLEMDQVVTVPHIGSATGRTHERMAESAGDSIIQALTGTFPTHVIPEMQKLKP